MSCVFKFLSSSSSCLLQVACLASWLCLVLSLGRSSSCVATHVVRCNTRLAQLGPPQVMHKSIEERVGQALTGGLTVNGRLQGSLVSMVTAFPGGAAALEALKIPQDNVP